MAMEVADHAVNMSRPPQGHRLHRPVSPWTRWSCWWAGWRRDGSRGQWSWNSKCQAGVWIGVLQVSSDYWDLWETLFCWQYWFKLPKKKKPPSGSSMEGWSSLLIAIDSQICPLFQLQRVRLNLQGKTAAVFTLSLSLIVKRGGLTSHYSLIPQYKSSSF